MRVLMLGWEFPPYISGGLGTACYGLTRAMSKLGTDVLFVLPRPIDASHSQHVQVLSPAEAARELGPLAARALQDVEFLSLDAALDPYARPVEVETDEGRPVQVVAPPEAWFAAGGIYPSKVIALEPGGDAESGSELGASPGAERDPGSGSAEAPAPNGSQAPLLPPGLPGSPEAAAFQPADQTARRAPGPFPAEAPTDAALRREVAAWAKHEPAGVMARLTAAQKRAITIGADYGGDLFSQIEHYADLTDMLVRSRHFDLIHAHDWMTYQAGLIARKRSGRPLILHVHSTELDRSGGNPDPRIFKIEQEAMKSADRVITVSFLTKAIVTRRYGVDERKVSVVYNAIDGDYAEALSQRTSIHGISPDEKIVLFLGRITGQKGPAFFVRAAKRVLSVYPKVRFIMAGSGDLAGEAIALADELGISDRVLFTGFLRGKDVARVFRAADLYVMPSVSEPFGIAPLEAICYDVPAIVSKQSGVAEILQHVLKVDFWDVDEIANKIVAVLRHPPLHATLRKQSGFEVSRLSWQRAARDCLDVYEDAVKPG
jgi:glycogen(starch) synthase